MSVDHLHTTRGRTEQDDREELLADLATSKSAALQRAKKYLKEHGETSARRRTRIDTIQSAIVTVYDHIDGRPRALGIRNCAGMKSFTLWTYWADVQLLEDGTFIQQCTYTDTKGRLVSIPLLLKPETTLNTHQLRTLIVHLGRLFAC